jgi:hypothetical protein
MRLQKTLHLIFRSLFSFAMLTLRGYRLPPHHDDTEKTGSVIPNIFFFVIPSVSEESSAWMLRFAQHDKLKMANLTLLSLALQKERDVCASRQGEVNPASGCFAPLSMTSDVIPSVSEESTVLVSPKQGEVRNRVRLP